MKRFFTKKGPKKVQEGLNQVSQTAPVHAEKRKPFGLKKSTSNTSATLQTEDDFSQILKDVTNHLRRLEYIGPSPILKIQQNQYQQICLFLLEKIKGKKIKKSSRNVNFILRNAEKYGIPVISTTHFQTPYAEPQWPHVFPFLQKLSEHAIQTVFPPTPHQPEAEPLREPTPEPLEPPESDDEDEDEDVASSRKRRLARRFTMPASSSNHETPRCSNIGDSIFRDASGALLPLTKEGFPNLNFKASKDWVKLQAEACEGVVPKWVSSRDFDVKLNNISKTFYKHYDEMYPSEMDH